MSKPEPTENERGEPIQASGPRTNPSLPTGGLRRVTLAPADGADPSPAGHGHSRAPTEVPPEDIPDPYVGATIDGRYYVEKQLGEGGMGVVYLCRHTIIDKQVAMKVLRADMARNEEVTERFLNEARSASSIGNPHIIDISDFGRLPDGATYFVMEFLTGTPLADLADARVALDPARVGHIGIQLTEGLAAAHEAGIIHRDLKPDNIFLVKQGRELDFVKILDFGIAKATTSSTKLTQAGQVFGTPHYMSPEQAAGSEVDHRSDIYAVGVILYELSTGRLPFDADNFMAILTQHMYKDPPPPAQVEGLPHELPAGLQDVILKCMAKTPDERYSNMSELGEELKLIFGDETSVGSRTMKSLSDAHSIPDDAFERASLTGGAIPAVPSAAPRGRSNVPVYAGIGALAALLAGGLVWALTSEEPQPEPEPIVVQAPEPAAAPEPEPEPVPEAPKTSQVAIAVAPLNAHVFHGETDLGESPVMIEVGEEPMALEIRLKGYKTEELTVDGSQPKVSIELQKEAVVKRRPVRRTAPRPAPKAKPKLGGGELVNPWD